MTTNNSDVIFDIVSAFQRHSDSDPNLTWLTKGFDATLRFLQRQYEATPEILWATALLLVVLEQGGTCLPFADLAAIEESARLPERLRAFTASDWNAVLVGEGLVAVDDTEDTPLVVVNDRLYFDRYFALEISIRDHAREPLSPQALAAPSDWASRVDQVFGSDDTGSARRMALDIWNQRLFLLVGGPGTGKTTTIASLLKLLLETGEEATRPVVLLCAPTSKAATRMKDAIVAASVNASPEVISRITHLSAHTIHKTLGITPATPHRRSKAPLQADFVICDEASMVDVALLSELLSACAPTTRIILVGDPGQLPSVDVGSVLKDLVEAAEHAGIAHSTLTTSYRTEGDAHELLQKLFTAIRAGDGPGALAIAESDSAAITFVKLDDDGVADDTLETAAINPVLLRARHLSEISQLMSSDDVINDAARTLQETMVLAAQHRGLYSRQWWVNEVTQRMEWRLGSTPHINGTPILITKTDAGNRLNNGDTGLVVRKESTSESTLWLSPNERGDESRSLAAIASWQPWWAMTIHMSQGSEFDTVIVSLTPGTRLISQELLYTAVTRAKKKIIIVATKDDFLSAVTTPARRLTGLREMLIN